MADSVTGVAVYDSTPYDGRSGWQVYSGTSVASPIIASADALAGNSAGINNNYPYTHHPSDRFFDITTGSNGSSSPTRQCHARAGWDGPTGLGTPNGVGGF